MNGKPEDRKMTEEVEIAKAQTREERCKEWNKKKAIIEERVYAIVKPIVDKHDPEGILSMGCPDDEYDPECREIAKAIVREGMSRMSKQELGNLLAFAWHYHFGHWGSEVRYSLAIFSHMAEEIHPALPVGNQGSTSSSII